jgi:ubiquinone/menaquinone biosynthesis C-methylase UbiE
VPEHDAPVGADVSGFHAVDRAADPQALIQFLARGKTQPVLQALEARMLQELRLDSASRVLDVGCGYGADAAEIAQRVGEGSVVGVDLSYTMIDEAKRRIGGRRLDLFFQVADAAALPFPDDAFDACRAEAVLEHMTNPGQAVAEMARVTRPGGRVVALDIDHGTTLLDHPDRPTTRLILDSATDAVASGWAGRQLRRLFGQAGLNEIVVQTHVMFPPAAFFRLFLEPQVARLQSAGTLAPEAAQRWWAAVEESAAADWFTASVTWFLAAGTVPSRRPHASV